MTSVAPILILAEPFAYNAVSLSNEKIKIIQCTSEYPAKWQLIKVSLNTHLVLILVQFF